MEIDRDKIASIIALLKIAKYDTEILGEKRDDSIDYLKEQLRIGGVSQQRELLIAFVDAWDKDEINVYNPPNEIADEFLAIYSG